MFAPWLALKRIMKLLMKKCSRQVVSDISKGRIACVIFAFLIGFSVVLTKIALLYASSLTVLTWRYNFATIAVVFVVLFSKRIRGQFTTVNKDLLIVAITYVGFMGLQTIGLKFTTSIEGAILFAIVPILTTILSGILIKEKSSMVQNIFMSISVAALIYMIVANVSGETSFNIVGTIILLAASISMAISNVWMRNVRGKISPFQISFMVCVLGSAIFNFARITTEGFEGYVAPLLQIEFVSLVVYLGVACIFFTAVLLS